MTTPRLPSAILDHYHQLLRDRETAVGAVRSIDRQLRSLAYALRVIDPRWEPPLHPSKLQAPSRLETGLVARDCARLLRTRGRQPTPEIARQIAETRRLRFESNADWLKFCSAVAMALRRFERKGFVRAVSKDSKTGAMTWELADSP